jgi:hypothetical protein
MNWLGAMAVTLTCAFAVSGCSHGSAHSAYVSRSAPDSRVLLVPELQGGWAGWSLTTGYRTMTEGYGPLRTTSSGPIFAEGSCSENRGRIEMYALTTSEVKAVSVAGGMPIPTTTNPTLPDGLRAAAVEVLRQNGQPNSRLRCPHMVPLDAQGRPIRKLGKPGGPQAFILPGLRLWEAPARPAKGVCELNATRLSPETVAEYGYVATRLRSYRGLLGRALLSCTSTVYVYHKERHLTAAVLLNASHPGTPPPPLPAMKPLPGDAGIFEAPGAQGEMVARRIPGAWLVVEEQGRIGRRVPVELLEHLHVTGVWDGSRVN